jgi:hypothetical protein
MIYLKNAEYDFIMKVSQDVDISTLTVYYVTYDFRSYTIVATSYEEALIVAGFTAEDTTKYDEGVY